MDLALRGGVRIRDVIATVREAHRAAGKPILVMSYWNPIDRYGVERFADELAEAGGAAASCPTCRCRNGAGGARHAENRGLATIFVVAPSSAGERLRQSRAAGSGFVYASALMGVTGTRASVSENAAGSLVRRVRAVTDLPVCVGIGISTAAQAARVTASPTA